jgi:hypothetical protein
MSEPKITIDAASWNRVVRERDEARELARVKLITPQKNTPVAEFFSSSSTPETDAFSVKFKSVCGSKAWVPTDICRRFERERDEARAVIRMLWQRAETYLDLSEEEIDRVNRSWGKSTK